MSARCATGVGTSRMAEWRGCGTGGVARPVEIGASRRSGLGAGDSADTGRAAGWGGCGGSRRACQHGAQLAWVLRAWRSGGAAERAVLRDLSKSEHRGEADWARAILLTLEGRQAGEIAAVLGVHVSTVRNWRGYFAHGGVA